MHPLELGVLGPLYVAVDRRPVELRRAKQRSLLALLLVNAGEVVSTDRLVDGLWGGRPPKTAVGSLQNLVSELRKLLGPDVLHTRPPGYVLEVDPAHVDLHRFQRLVADALEEPAAERRAEILRDALALWRGPPLADLAFEPFAQVAVARLDELRTSAREELIEAELDLGLHAKLVAEIEGLVAEHPLRERLRGQLMLALYRSGRQAEALDVYRETRQTLVEELGIDPSPELQRLEQAILRHDSELDLVPKRAPAASAAEPELADRRKTVTIMFADIVDSTSLSAQLDPEIVRSVMRRYYDTVRTIVERHGGTIEKFVGDAAMAVFGIPELHEDDALRAVRAAKDLREALGPLNAELGADHELSIEVRTAVNTGEVIAADTATGQHFAAGGPVNVAMRLQQAALPGETLVGAATEPLIRDGVTTEPVETVDLGGALGRVEAFRLVAIAADAGARPLRGPFVGRAEELASLRRAFDEVVTERRSAVFALIGDAGIGKSRLVAELVSSLGDEATVVYGRCVSYGEGATFLPLAEIVRQVAPQRPRVALTKLLGGDEDAELVARRVTDLTGDTDGTASTGEAFWAIRRLLEALARQKPLLVVLEDVHWAEPTLLELVEYLASWTADAPLLVLCLARPDLLEKRPGWHLVGESLTLAALSEDETRQLLSALAGAIGVSERVSSRIVDAAEGNPLFAGQLHAYLSEDQAGHEVVVPPTVEALLASRLERLEPLERELLERAAVVGKDFSRAAVLHLSPPEQLAGIDAALRALERKNLVEALRPEAHHEELLRFHHVLIRDVAYSGATKLVRAELHERLATWLEHRDELDELIGYHAEQAHRLRAEIRSGDPELARLAAWAGERLAAGGMRAWKRADTPAAVNLLGRAAALLPADSAERAEALCELGVAQRGLGELHSASASLMEAVEAAAATQQPRIEFLARIELARAHVLDESAEGVDDLLALAEQAVPVFEELGDDLALGRTWRHVGHARGEIQGCVAAWQEASERALTHYRRSGWSISGCLADLAAALFYGPAPVAQGLARCDELLSEATERVGRANVQAFMAGLHAYNGDVDEARRVVTEAATTYAEIGEVYAVANNSGRVRSRIEVLAGEPAAAEAVLRASCETFERVHDKAGLATLAAELADALYLQGRFDEAESWAELAERSALPADLTAQYGWRRVRAKLLARRQLPEQAEAVALEAAALAERTDALNDRGVVLLDLAEVHRLGGRAADAARVAERARGLFSRKKNRVSAGEARALRDEAAVA